VRGRGAKVIWEVRQGDTLEQLRLMPDGCVQTCVTSPPYFGLRDYGTGEWEGGDEGCDHVEKFNRKDGNRQGANCFAGNANREGHADMGTRRFRDVCGKCGARRIDQQVGLESTPDEYVNRLVEVFREVRRVLRDDGTLWLNLGDSYMARQFGWNNSNDRSWAAYHRETGDERPKADRSGHSMEGSHAMAKATGMKPKDLIGIPWMVAFALRADGWYLRSDIIWSKPNPMPESVTDRPTKAHEYVFLLSKGPRYFYAADAVRENWADERNGASGATVSKFEDMGSRGRGDGGITNAPQVAGRNKRSVWTVATQPFPGAHFAVFPPKLIEPCVLAGSAEGDTVLDPFCGAGTTGLVATRNNRSFIGIELNPDYAEMARQRIRDDQPLMNYLTETAA
jgi:DNA modification methylase